MKHSYFVVKYLFYLPDSEKEFTFQIDKKTLRLINGQHRFLPAETALDYHQCPHCPFDRTRFDRSPVAVSIVEVIKPFSTLKSHEELFVEVKVMDRTITKTTREEDAISAMMGRVIACSSCPHTHFFKPMARYHLPFSNINETKLRMVGNYLTGEFMQNGTQREGILDGLVNICQNMQALNSAIADRLRNAIPRDPTLGALILLDGNVI